MANHKKLHGEFVDRQFIAKRKAKAQGMGFEMPRYIEFIEKMINLGYSVKLHEAYQTASKYVTVYGGHDLKYKVRFSNHKPIRTLELNETCNFFVGKTHTGTRTTSMAIEAVREWFNAV